MRQHIERQIARRLILDAIQQGYTVSVYNGECIAISKSNNCKAILDAMFQTDEETLRFFKDDKRIGWACLIYGNGCDVLSDYSVTIEHFVKGANNLADKYQ
jgi:hypothetical protein